MRMNCARVIAAALPLAFLTGCSDFLANETAIKDPNNPSEATRDQLFVAAQTTIFGLQESGVAQLACMWVQACSGVGGRFVETRGTNYTVLPADLSADFSQVYLGGGLVDLRRIQQGATTDGDKVYEGIAKVLEALLVSFAADVWGDVPYREAASDAISPVFDPQLQVYADLQTLLSGAIADLGGAGTGPGPVDLIYGGNTTKWIAAANTLKARLYLHTAEGATRGTFNNAAYQSAITAATSGIASAANDLSAFHGQATAERNIWGQFAGTGFGQDLVAGSVLVNLLKARNDPRLPLYFAVNGAGGFGGNDVNAATPADQISALSDVRLAPDFRQPLITWEENQLILAEARFQTSGAAAALPHVNAVRQAVGLTPFTVSQVTPRSIMEEKYIALFQNIEAWSDYRRTCFPVLDPAGAAAVIPGRIYYGVAEQNANPNTPSVAEQNTRNAGRNPNDRTACTP